MSRRQKKIFDITKENIRLRICGGNDTMPQKRRKLDSDRFMSVMKDPRENPVKKKR